MLPSLQFNENLRRNTKKTEEGRAYVNVIYPKFKMGEEDVREVAKRPTYGMYVQHLHYVQTRPRLVNRKRKHF